MKKAMVYIIAMTLALSAMLSGCGEIKRTEPNKVTPVPPHSPAVSNVPESMMPNPEDGVVRDGDGIITDDDSGTATEKTPIMPRESSAPGAGAGKNSGKNGTTGSTGIRH